MPELADVPRLDRDTLNRQISSMWGKNKDELRAIINSPTETMGNIVIASIVAKAATLGDATRMSSILEYLFPKRSELKVEGQLTLEQILAKSVEPKE